MRTNAAYRIAPSRSCLTKVYNFHMCIIRNYAQLKRHQQGVGVSFQLCFDKWCIVVVQHFPPSLSYLHSTESVHSRKWKRSLPRPDKIASQHVELRILVAFIQRCVPINRHRTCSFTACNSACSEVQVWTLTLSSRANGLPSRDGPRVRYSCCENAVFSCSYVDNSGTRSGAVR